MQDAPSARELLGAVRAFLEGLARNELSGRSAFHARVSANALSIVEREIERAPDANRAEAERLRALLGTGGDLAALNRELARRIRSRELPLDHPGLVEHLRATTLDKLAIDQPGYASYRRARARRGGPPDAPDAPDAASSPGPSEA